MSRLCILAQYMSVWSHAPAIAGLYTCGINLIGAKAVLVDQARIDKGVLKRLEKELGELRSLSASVLGPLARWQQPLKGPQQDEYA